VEVDETAASVAEDHGRFINALDRISERPPRGGLSVCVVMSGYGSWTCTHPCPHLQSLLG